MWSLKWNHVSSRSFSSLPPWAGTMEKTAFNLSFFHYYFSLSFKHFSIYYRFSSPLGLEKLPAESFDDWAFCWAVPTSHSPSFLYTFWHFVCEHVSICTRSVNWRSCVCMCVCTRLCWVPFIASVAYVQVKPATIAVTSVHCLTSCCTWLGSGEWNLKECIRVCACLCSHT